MLTGDQQFHFLESLAQECQNEIYVSDENGPEHCVKGFVVAEVILDNMILGI